MKFRGERWPGARITAARPAYVFDDKPPVPGEPQLFTVEAGGKPRPWMASGPVGFWRNFAELDLASADQVAGFIHKHGDINGWLTEKQPAETRYWDTLRAYLRTAARAWEPPRRSDGTSLIVDDATILEAARRWYPTGEKLLETEVVADSETGALALQPRTLGSLLMLSAGDMLSRRVPMRVCPICGDYFELISTKKRFCSTSCRVRAHERNP